MSDDKRETWQVSTIIERKDEKPIFVRIGAAWENRDGSFNLKLNALPTNGTLHMRLPREDDRRDERRDDRRDERRDDRRDGGPRGFRREGGGK